ncbi:ArsR/SmtB family transcription factor [Streptacidiphilus sp. MAP12-16]|uniref:ArsR/SmtB family transcription factor n=1 Tax=Streptacidiphilus sp. MAP12-16 TaxID=3156300 RepID=UPI0035169F04
MSTEGRSATASENPQGAKSRLRELRDARVLRALAHPTRIALLEVLAVRGTLTATEAAEAVGGNASNASYHLRTLASHGYVVEAEGGSGRERPWKLGSTGMTFDDDDADPTVAQAARALSEIMATRWSSRHQRYRQRREQYPAAVRAVTGDSQFVLFCTPDELKQVQADILEVLLAYQHRVEEPSARPFGALPFELLLSTFPFELEPAGAEDPDNPEG